MSNDVDFDVSLLLDIDVDTFRETLQVDRLQLEDLDKIDWDLVSSNVLGIMDPVGQLRDWLAGVLNSLFDSLKKFLEGLITPIRDALSALVDAVNRVVVKPILDALNWIRDNFPKITSAVGDLLGKVFDAIMRLPGVVRDFASRVAATFSELADRVTSGFKWLLDQLTKLPGTIRDMLGRVAGVVGELLDRVRAGFTWLIDRVRELPDLIRGVVERVTSALLDLAERASKGLSALLDMISKAPALIRDVLSTIIGDVARGVGGVVEWIRRGFEGLGRVIFSWFEGARGWFEAATGALRQLGAIFTGFVNAVMQLPERLRAAFKGIVEFFEGLWTGLQEFIRDPAGWLRTHIVEPVWRGLVAIGTTIWDGLVKFGELVWRGLSWLWEKVVAGVRWLRDRAVDFAVKWVELSAKAAEGLRNIFLNILRAFLSPLLLPVIMTARDVEDVLQSALTRTAGVAENMWLTGGLLLPPYWTVTLLPLAIRGVVRALGDLELVIEPTVLGSKGGGVRWSVKLSELADAFVRGFEMYYSAYAIGSSMAIANMFMVNLHQLYTPRVVTYYDRRIRDILGDVLKDELEAGALVNMFLKPVSETALIDYARRMLALSEGLKDEKRLKQLLSTIRAHLKIYGLPAWYIDFLTRHPEELKVAFIDRFGADRRIYLSHIFELPTHSELARMTQRDIFPGVDVMKKVAWVRGWNEDLTTMIYLLTFRYPSFEKLWTFYMRALAGMLWFSPPDVIKKVFDKEAEEVKAGKPISPLDLQKALRGPDQVKAFELALNTYFKWLEYSNFSWFTDKTSMYGINVGAEIVSKLGGWTADSWLLADVAADIPSKIDMRWMSRYGIFLHMAKKFEEAGVRFETYTPLVEAVPKLLEPSAATPIQVDLRWFSKLLQATGLHPAWVPVVTVAENIMVIADEMTLLRTGWLNLFKEGMITVDDAEKYLAGLIVTSYQVGYWDPEKKVWTSGWINLPVRWLPHERKLLQLRMAIDRVMDVFREIYSYIRSGIRTLAITPEDAKSKLSTLVGELNKHYKELTKAITGQEFEIKLDEKYIAVWLELQKLAQDIEAYERVRIWWSRVSGWILYRVAYGWVTEEEIASLIDTVSKYIPLHKVEVEAYKEIAKALLGIARKEAIPSPSTLAVFAEYMVIDTKVVEDVLSKYNVPGEYWDLWKTYIAVKPVKADYRAVLNTALRALRYNVITKEYWESLLRNATQYGFTPIEVNLLQLRAELELMVEEARLWRPSLLTLITISEYVPEAVKLLEYYRVDPVFRPVIERYALVKPLADEVRILVNALYRAKRYVAIPKELEDRVLAIVKQLGVTDVELMIRDLALELTVLVDEAREYIPTLSTLAVMAEYLPEVRKYLREVFEARRVRGVWAEVWTKYIYLRPVFDEVRRWATAMFTLAEHLIIDLKQLDPIFDILKTYGWEELEITIATRTILAEQVRYAFSAILGAPRTIAGMARYTDKAADWAYSRAVKLIDALPVDENAKKLLKEMWKEYIMSYQAYPEIRSYMTELINAYADGVIDDKGLEDELGYLKKIGVPELRLAFAKRTAQLRRVRRLARVAYR
jgi:hypothetical protein